MVDGQIGEVQVETLSDTSRNCLQPEGNEDQPLWVGIYSSWQPQLYVWALTLLVASATAAIIYLIPRRKESAGNNAAVAVAGNSAANINYEQAAFLTRLRNGIARSGQWVGYGIFHPGSIAQQFNIYFNSQITLVERLKALEEEAKLALRKNTSLQKALELFEPLNSSPKVGDKETMALEETVKLFLAEQNNAKILLLLGNAGAGKTLYCMHLLHQQWPKVWTEGARIPLYVSLPLLKDPEHSLMHETLSKKGWSESDINELRKEQTPLLLFLDGYNELALGETNIIASNELSAFNVRIIITCRSQYLSLNYRQSFMLSNDQHESLTEACIVPFSKEQQDSYIERFVQLKYNKRGWSELRQYKHAFDLFPTLRHMAKDPFSLALMLNILPQLVESGQSNLQGLTRAEVFEKFISDWYQNEISHQNSTALISNKYWQKLRKILVFLTILAKILMRSTIA